VGLLEREVVRLIMVEVVWLLEWEVVELMMVAVFVLQWLAVLRVGLNHSLSSPSAQQNLMVQTLVAVLTQ
jgi:hypothetical protein